MQCIMKWVVLNFVGVCETAYQINVVVALVWVNYASPNVMAKEKTESQSDAGIVQVRIDFK